MNACECVFEGLSTQGLINLKNFIITLTVSSLKNDWDQNKIQSEWENIEDSLSCLKNIEEEITNQHTYDDLFAILYYTLSSDIEINKEIENKVSEKLLDKPKKEVNTSQKIKADKNSFETKTKKLGNVPK